MLNLNPISRRCFLAFAAMSPPMGSVLAASEAISSDLGKLIDTHRIAYDEFHRIVHNRESSKRNCERADSEEQEALLAICSYPAIAESDRRAKSDYLLAIEARGELDLTEHIRAILHSI